MDALRAGKCLPVTDDEQRGPPSPLEQVEALRISDANGAWQNATVRAEPLPPTGLGQDQRDGHGSVPQEPKRQIPVFGSQYPDRTAQVVDEARLVIVARQEVGAGWGV